MIPNYELIPVGSTGPILPRAVKVFGPDLDVRRALAEENERLRRELDAARRVAAGAERLQRLLDNEYALRARAQQRLHLVAVCLSAIARAFPQAADVVEKAREEIWRAGDV